MNVHPDHTHAHMPDCGHCGACKHWQSDPDALDHDRVGLCEHPEIVRFQLQVSDDSGCNRFEPAEVMAGDSPGVRGYA